MGIILWTNQKGDLEFSMLNEGEAGAYEKGIAWRVRSFLSVELALIRKVFRDNR
jgi:hypothetical protein